MYNMNYRVSSAKKLLFAVVLSTLFVSSAAAEWNITVADHTITDGDNIFTSQDQNTVVLVELKTSRGEAINGSSLTDSSDVLYTYNESTGSSNPLEHYQGAYWYAEFPADISKHGLSGNNAEILFEAQGDRNPDDGVNSDGWQNDTAILNVGNFTVNVEEGLNSRFVPGEKVNMSVNVTNRVTSQNVNDTNVYAFFRNGSWTQQGNIGFSYNETTDLYEASVTVPEDYSSEYLMRMVAVNRSKTMADPHGSASAFVQTAPEFTGDVINFTRLKGCESIDDSNFAAQCEPNGTIDTSFNVTGASADNVTLSGYKINKSSGELVQYFNRSMDESEGLYHAEFQVPEINTSAFEDQVSIQYNLSRGDRSDVVVRKISYSALDIVHIGTRSASQGTPYDLSFQVMKPISLTPYMESGIDTADVKVSTPSGDLFEDYNLSNLTFDGQENTFDREIDIPDTAEVGGWDLELSASKYAESITVNSGFSVASTDQTFEVNDTTFEKDNQEVESFNLTVRNIRDNNLTIQTNLSDTLTGEIEVNETVNISASSTEQIPVTVNLTEFEDIEGDINLTDIGTGYERTVGLTVDVKKCEFTSGDICSLNKKWVNVTADNRGLHTERVRFLDTAYDGNSTNVTANVEGNISDLISLEDRYLLDENLTAQVNYTVEQVGNYTGTITFQPENESDNSFELVFNTTLETGFEEIKETGFSTDPEDVDLGVFPTGETVRSEITVQNTGDLEIQNIDVSSSQYSVSLNVTDLNVSGSQSRDVELVFEETSTEEGNLTLTGNTSEGEVSTNLTVNATPVENYADRTNELSERRRSLEPVRGSNLTATMNDVSGLVTSIESSWEEGNYLEARTKFRKAQNKLDYVANNKEDTGDSGNDTGDQDTGNQDGTTDGTNDENTGGNQNQDGTQTEEEGGGLPIIPIVAVFVVLLIVGFVVYESYIPEEGDPLYGVLGDQ